MQQHQARFQTPFGPIGMRWRAGRLVSVDLRVALEPDRCAERREQVPDWLGAPLRAYFADPRQVPRVPLEVVGTPFQQRVWRALQGMPPGVLVTYGELARRLDSGARALGSACRANPWPILVPCHRVVGATGLGGFAGARDGGLLAIKRWLLEHEGALGGAR